MTAEAIASGSGSGNTCNPYITMYGYVCIVIACLAIYIHIDIV